MSILRRFSRRLLLPAWARGVAALAAAAMFAANSAELSHRRVRFEFETKPRIALSAEIRGAGLVVTWETFNVPLVGLPVLFRDPVLVAPRSILPSVKSGVDYARWRSLLLPFPFLGLCFALLIVLPRPWKKSLGPGHCTKCGYDIRGLAAESCPECGVPISSPACASSTSQPG